MNLVLVIEEQHRGLMHSALIAALEQIAASHHDLDGALAAVRAHVSPDWWLAGRGGSHVWLSWQNPGKTHEPVRVAMIVERGDESMPRRKGKRAVMAKRAVEVQYWSAGEKPHGIDAQIGVDYAKFGRPVDIVLRDVVGNGNQSHRVHISLAEARDLAAQLQPLLKLSEEA